MPCRRSKASRGWHDHRPRRAPAPPEHAPPFWMGFFQMALIGKAQAEHPPRTGGFETYDLTWPRAPNPKLNGESEI